MKLNIIYEDNDVLVIDKPAGLSVFKEGNIIEKTLAEYLLEQYPDFKKAGDPPRYGIIHRLDKDTSGVLLTAKNPQGLIFFQKQFKKGAVKKKYLALVCGGFESKEGEIKTLIGRSRQNPKKQKVFLPQEPGAEGKREAITYYKVVRNFKEYALLEVLPKTGRKHQIRCHLAYIHRPIAGDKLYGFKNQPEPKDLTRQFLHASYIKIKMPNGETKEFASELPEELERIIKELKPQ